MKKPKPPLEPPHPLGLRVWLCMRQMRAASPGSTRATDVGRAMGAYYCDVLRTIRMLEYEGWVVYVYGPDPYDGSRVNPGQQYPLPDGAAQGWNALEQQRKVQHLHSPPQGGYPRAIRKGNQTKIGGEWPPFIPAPSPYRAAAEATDIHIHVPDPLRDALHRLVEKDPIAHALCMATNEQINAEITRRKFMRLDPLAVVLGVPGEAK